MWETTCDFCMFQNVEVFFPATCAFLFSLHMRVDVEKAAEQRLATFQKCNAKSPFIHSNLRFSVPERTSSPLNHWRPWSSKTKWGINWNYQWMIDFSFFFFQITRTLKKMMPIFILLKQVDHRWGGCWDKIVVLEFLKFFSHLLFMLHICVHVLSVKLILGPYPYICNT